ncbi:MAG: hypothetical protein ACRD1K_01335 [Acidimicrobiales bacterium]
MVVDERSRHELYQRLESTIGADAAGTLMAHLPPVGWADVATKADLAQMQAATKADMTQLRQQMDLRFEAVGQQMDLRFEAVGQQMDQRFESADHKLEAMGSRIVGELRKEINDAIVSQTKVFAYSLIGAVMGTGSLVLAAVRLG